MRNTYLGFCVLALWSSSGVAAEPSITVKRLDDNAFELTLTTDRTVDVSEGQRSLAPTAQRLCTGANATFGHYKFETLEPITAQESARRTMVLRQDIRCEVASSAPVPSYAAPPAGHDDKAIEKLTYAYLAAKDAAKYSDAYAFFTESMKTATSLESWSSNIRAFNAVAGHVKTRAIKKITWYDNPPSAPVPGTYAAADYVSQFENLSVHCGYVVWLGSSDGLFRVVREEQNYIDKASETKMTPEQKKAFIKRYGC